jgi:hypothetical protein
MLSGRIAFAALGIACVAAAAGGSYLATRHNIADTAAPGLTAASVPGDTAATAAPAQTSVAVADAAAPAPDVAAPRAPRAAAQPSLPSRQATAPALQSAPQVARVEPVPAAADRPVAGIAPAMPAPPAEQAPTTRVDDRSYDAPKPVEPPVPTFDELVVAADSVIGLRLENSLSSERARVEDRVEARVVRDIRVNGRVAVPAGSRVQGVVTAVERGGRVRERAQLGIRFNTLQLTDGTRLPISTGTIFRYGEAPGNDTAKKVGGGAVAGTILGAIIGGGKGAAIGAAAGAAGGGAMVMRGERSEAVFEAGGDITVAIRAPLTITVER